MTEKPIFELFRDEERYSTAELVKIFVDWNGKRMPLLDVTRILEKKFFDIMPNYEGYNWHLAYRIYEAHQNENEYVKILDYGGESFCVKITETEDQVIWSRVFVYEHLCRMRTPEEGIPHGFEDIHYPDFVFDKTIYYEEMEKLRAAYERQKRIDEEELREHRIASVRNHFWNKETLNIDTLDYALLVRPQHTGPIFEVFYYDEEKYRQGNCVKIFVELDGQRRSFIDVLKEWETPFHAKLAGDYFWSSVITTYEELVVRKRRMPFFRELLVCGGCGEFGCSYIRFQVRETDDLVIWTNFHHPYRDKYSPGGYWDYSNYPPLIFDKQQYYAELETMRPAYEQHIARRIERNLPGT